MSRAEREEQRKKDTADFIRNHEAEIFLSSDGVLLEDYQKVMDNFLSARRRATGSSQKRPGDMQIQLLKREFKLRKTPLPPSSAEVTARRLPDLGGGACAGGGLEGSFGDDHHSSEETWGGACSRRMLGSSSSEDEEVENARHEARSAAPVRIDALLGRLREVGEQGDDSDDVDKEDTDDEEDDYMSGESRGRGTSSPEITDDEGGAGAGGAHDEGGACNSSGRELIGMGVHEERKLVLEFEAASKACRYAVRKLMKSQLPSVRGHSLVPPLPERDRYHYQKAASVAASRLDAAEDALKSFRTSMRRR
jgi:hypothetical protein